ncbi:MAG: flagellar hook-associated protein FlgL [Thermacetogeniaceae bacterium]
MRITQSMMANNVLNNLSNDLQSMQTAENQLSTGLAVTKPSDNPLATSQIMSLNTSISMQGMYYSNMQSASSFLSTTDSALTDTVSSLQQVQSLVTEGANGTENSTDLQTLGGQVNQIISELVQTGNAINGSQYVFGGTQTTTPPLATTTDADGNITAVTYQGNSGQINYEVAQGVQMPVNTNGADLFQVTGNTSMGNTNMFNTLITIKNDMENDDTTDLSSMLSQIDDITTNVESQQAAVGAKEDRLNTAMTRNQNDNTTMTTALSNLQDVDIDQASVEFSEKSNVYQAALETAAKVMTPTLVDYLTT